MKRWEWVAFWLAALVVTAAILAARWWFGVMMIRWALRP